MIIPLNHSQCRVHYNKVPEDPLGFVDVTSKSDLNVLLVGKDATVWLREDVRELLIGLDWRINLRITKLHSYVSSTGSIFEPFLYAYGPKEKLLMLKLAL